MMLAGMIVVVVSLMLFTHRRLRRSQQRPTNHARNRYNEMDRQASVRRGIDETMLQLDQLARQVHGQLDTRFAKLEAIIRDADQRIDRLSRLVRQRQGQATVDLTLDAEDPHEPSPKPPTPNHTADHAHASIWRLADSGMSAPEIAKEVGKLTGEVELILSLRRTRQAAEKEHIQSDLRPSVTGVKNFRQGSAL